MVKSILLAKDIGRFTKDISDRDKEAKKSFSYFESNSRCSISQDFRYISSYAWKPDVNYQAIQRFIPDHDFQYNLMRLFNEEALLTIGDPTEISRK